MLSRKARLHILPSSPEQEALGAVTYAGAGVKPPSFAGFQCLTGKKYGPLIQMNSLQQAHRGSRETGFHALSPFAKQFVFLHLFVIAMSETCKYCEWLSNTHLVN